VAIKDADVFHAHAVYAQQIISAGMEERGIDRQRFFNVLLRQDRSARCHTADDRQAAVFGFGFEAWNADASRGARCHFDCALACQRLEVFFSGVR
nr:hypothetical protein [Tanacetum cinerariifolium]